MRNWFAVRGINLTLAQEGTLSSVGGAQGAVIGAQPVGAPGVSAVKQVVIGIAA